MLDLRPRQNVPIIETFTSIVHQLILHSCKRFDRQGVKGIHSEFRELLIRELTMYVEKGIVRTLDPEKFSDLNISLVEGFGFYQNICDNNFRLDELGPHLKELTLRWLKEGKKIICQEISAVFCINIH